MKDKDKWEWEPNPNNPNGLLEYLLWKDQQEDDIT